jgi:hypothetical protein
MMATTLVCVNQNHRRFVLNQNFGILPHSTSGVKCFIAGHWRKGNVQYIFKRSNSFSETLGVRSKNIKVENVDPKMWESEWPFTFVKFSFNWYISLSNYYINLISFPSCVSAASSSKNGANGGSRAENHKGLIFFKAKIIYSIFPPIEWFIK